MLSDFVKFLVHRVMEVRNAAAIIQTIIISSKCLSLNLEVTDNVKIVNPHTIVEKIVWNVLMDTIVVIIA